MSKIPKWTTRKSIDCQQLSARLVSTMQCHPKCNKVLIPHTSESKDSSFKSNGGKCTAKGLTQLSPPPHKKRGEQTGSAWWASEIRQYSNQIRTRLKMPGSSRMLNLSIRGDCGMERGKGTEGPKWNKFYKQGNCICRAWMLHMTTKLPVHIVSRLNIPKILMRENSSFW